MQATGHRIPVTSIDASLPFYEKLGFVVVFQSEEYGWASLQHGDFALGLYVAGKGGGTRGPGDNIGFLFAVPELEAYHARISSEGLEPTEIATSDDGMKLFDIQDPSGNDLTFSR